MTEGLRALSILQPWAHAIVHLGKRIENRAWPAGCSFRGEILIHASNGAGTIADFDSAIESILNATRVSAHAIAELRNTKKHGPRWYPGPKLQRGGIVGRARIVGEVFCDMTGHATVCDGPVRGIESREMTSRERAWWTGGFALVLADVQPLPFVPCRGALGLWRVPQDVQREIGKVHDGR